MEAIYFNVLRSVNRHSNHVEANETGLGDLHVSGTLDG